MSPVNCPVCSGKGSLGGNVDDVGDECAACDGTGRVLPPVEAPIPTPGMTPAEAQIAAAAMFEPTIRRMAVLVSTLISVTENGDFALWSVLATLDTVLADLKFDSISRENALKFFATVATALQMYGARYDEYVAQVEGAPDAPLPPLPVFRTQDATGVYDLVAARFAPKDPA